MCSIPTANERLTLFICLFSLVFRDKVSLCSPGCPKTRFVDQAGLELRDLLSIPGIKGVNNCFRALTSRQVNSEASFRAPPGQLAEPALRDSAGKVIVVV